LKCIVCNSERKEIVEILEKQKNNEFASYNTFRLRDIAICEFCLLDLAKFLIGLYKSAEKQL